LSRSIKKLYFYKLSVLGKLELIAEAKLKFMGKEEIFVDDYDLIFTREITENEREMVSYTLHKLYFIPT